MWATWTHWTNPLTERRRVLGALWRHARGETHVGWPNKVKVYCLMWPVRGKFKRGMQAWVGRARTADARFLRSIIDRCVSLLDSIAPPSAEHPLSLLLSHILCFKTPLAFFHTRHTLHTHSLLGLTTSAHPGFSRLVPPPVCPSPASTKSSGRGLYKPLSPRLS